MLILKPSHDTSRHYSSPFWKTFSISRTKMFGIFAINPYLCVYYQ